MSYTESELSALRRAYASGTLEVRYDGKSVRYDTGEELLRRIRVIEAEMQKATGASRHMAVFTTFNRG